MNGLAANNRSFRRLMRDNATRVFTVWSIGIMFAVGSITRPGELSAQDQGASAATPAKVKKKAATPGQKPGQAKRAEATKKAEAEAVHGPLPKRPARSVTPPTLTPADLDRLITQFLTKNSPKVEPATLTTDVEYVRRIYFDLAGRPPTPDAGSDFLARPLERQAAPTDRHLARQSANTLTTGPSTGATW